jgi:hypothetical protein
MFTIAISARIKTVHAWFVFKKTVKSFPFAFSVAIMRSYWKIERVILIFKVREDWRMVWFVICVNYTNQTFWAVRLATWISVDNVLKVLNLKSLSSLRAKKSKVSVYVKTLKMNTKIWRLELWYVPMVK